MTDVGFVALACGLIIGIGALGACFGGNATIIAAAANVAASGMATHAGKPIAFARLTRPEGTHEFEAVINVSQAYLDVVKEGELTILLNGEQVVREKITKSGWLTKRWPIPGKPAGPVAVEFRVLPIFHPNADDKTIEYGLPIAGFGFPSGSATTEARP